jgi:hypothetical protein
MLPVAYVRTDVVLTVAGSPDFAAATILVLSLPFAGTREKNLPSVGKRVFAMFFLHIATCGASIARTTKSVVRMPLLHGR